MKKCIDYFILAMLFSSVSAFAQKAIPVYDSLLAKKLNADEYGMKKYVLVILQTGDSKLEKGPRRDSLFAGHMQNIGRLATAGQLAVAGPIGTNDKSYRGIFIFNVSTIPEAQKLCASDPTVKAGIFTPLYFEWYGTAALMEVNRIHSTLERKKH